MRYLCFLAFALSVVFASVACTGAFDWSSIRFPCNESRVCADGFVCERGFCVTQGSATENPEDGGVEHDPDSPFRPPLSKPRIAYLLSGPVGDYGWVWAHNQGRQYLASLGYETAFAESISPTAAPAQMEDFIQRGYNVIIGASSDYLIPLLSKTSLHPNTSFLTCAGFETGRNMGSYFGRMYQAEWLAGMVAGATTKTNRVGIVVTVAIPQLVRHINAFTNGVRTINPQATVSVVWISTWFDAKKEPILTQELLDNEVDVIHGHSNTSIPLEYVENKDGQPRTTKKGLNAYTIGYNSLNICSFGPRTCLTSAYWNWGPIVARIIDKMKNGTWDPSVTVWESMRSDRNDSVVYLSEISPTVSGTARIQVQGFIPQLVKEGVEGQQLPFKGPQLDNTGKERLAAGQYFTDKQLLDMCWYVQGVVNPDGTPAVVPTECKGER